MELEEFRILKPIGFRGLEGEKRRTKTGWL